MLKGASGMSGIFESKVLCICLSTMSSAGEEKNWVSFQFASFAHLLSTAMGRRLGQTFIDIDTQFCHWWANKKDTFIYVQEWVFLKNRQINSIAITYPIASHIHFCGSNSKFLSSLSAHRIREVIAVEWIWRFMLFLKKTHSNSINRFRHCFVM